VTAGRCDVPPECASIDCGFVGDVFCGDCTSGALCGVVTPNSCDRPAPCSAASATCGLLTANGAPVWCGNCDVNQACIDHTCAESPRPFCWPEERPLPLRNSERPVFVPDPTPSLYVATKLYIDEHDDEGCRRHAIMPLRSHGIVDTSTVIRLGTTDLDHLSPAQCRPPNNGSCDGYAEHPRVRADGLEMFFSASYPCADWWDPELYLATRPDLHSPWEAPVFLSGLSTFVADIDDGVMNPVLLEDRRTLLYATRSPEGGSESHRNIHIARRQTTVPGDTSFVRVGSHEIEPATSEDGGRVYLVLLWDVSCDGEYLLYKREVSLNTGTRVEPRRARLSWPGPTFGEPEPWDAVPQGTHAAATSIGIAAETADCSAIYIGRRGGEVSYKLRRPCP